MTENFENLEIAAAQERAVEKKVNYTLCVIDIRAAICARRIRIEQMEQYLLMKFEQKDWHGVQDAASDLRDLESEIAGLELAYKRIAPVPVDKNNTAIKHDAAVPPSK